MDYLNYVRQIHLTLNQITPNQKFNEFLELYKTLTPVEYAKIMKFINKYPQIKKTSDCEYMLDIPITPKAAKIWRDKIMGINVENIHISTMKFYKKNVSTIIIYLNKCVYPDQNTNLMHINEILCSNPKYFINMELIKKWCHYTYSHGMCFYHINHHNRPTFLICMCFKCGNYIKSKSSPHESATCSCYS